LESRLLEGLGQGVSPNGVRSSVPVIDLDLLRAPADLATRKLLWEAASGVGFFQVVNHGLARGEVAQAFAHSQRWPSHY